MDEHPTGSGAFAKFLGVRLVRQDESGVELDMVVGKDHLNANNIVHGGVLMTLLDMAMATTVTASLGPTERTASVTIHTDFLKAATPGRLVARGRLERRGRTMAFPLGEVRDGEGALLARGSGVWAITTRAASGARRQG